MVSLAGAVEAVARWRQDNLRIGFTNGCFDLLHPGHVSLLEQARAATDRLLVGLNSDSSIGRIKGDGRPIQAEAARAQVGANQPAGESYSYLPDQRRPVHRLAHQVAVEAGGGVDPDEGGRGGGGAFDVGPAEQD